MPYPRRIISANQKGGVGKTTEAALLAQAYAEAGNRTLLVDYDPQGDMTVWHGLPRIPLDDENRQHSLTQHLLGRGGQRDVRELVSPIEEEVFGGRLFILRTCMDMFLLEASLGQVRAKEAALERALAPLEEDFDVIIIDCPPSLGLAMDAAVYYGRTRQGEPEKRSGIVIPVQAEDSSVEAYKIFTWQINGLISDLNLPVEMLGFVLNLYDSRRGTIARTTKELWESLGEPPVLATFPDLKEQREAVRLKRPLFALYPDCEQARLARGVVKALEA